ncbi:MAG: inositol monophosphatase family protein [Ignisphaera sp.]
MSYLNLEDKVLKCIEKTRQYLLSGSAPDTVIGYNPYGDVSKVFDLEAEDILAKCLADELKDVVVIGEEKGVRLYGLAKYIAIIDPVDGSRNFEADIPWSSISVAVGLNRGSKTCLRDVVLAIVSEIQRHRIYVYNNTQIKILGPNIARKTIPKGIILGYFDNINSLRILDAYLKNYGESKVLRSLGSAALDIVSVGLGNAEIFIDIRNKLRNLDIAAALRIALALGSQAYVFGYSDPLDIPIDNVVKISCIVGFNKDYLGNALKILKKTTSQDYTS